MNRGLIAFIVVAAVGLTSTFIIYIKRSAEAASRKSDELLEEFKRVDRGLKESSIKADSSIQMLLDSLNKQVK
jgi:hypothetical protein